MNWGQDKARGFLSALLLGSSRDKGSYRRFRFTLYGAMFVIFFFPLYISAGLSGMEYKKLLAKEEKEQLVWQTEGAQKSLEAFIHQLQAVVQFVAQEYSYRELLDQKKVSDLFAHLRDQYPGFVDLGVIGPEGIQQRYAGPFHLEGYDYSKQDWYEKVLVRQIYISDVFMGYRNLPHFVVAVSTKVPGLEEYWVLRLSVDSETLQQYLARISTKASNDIFLVNEDGVLQTKSYLFGESDSKCPIFARHKKAGVNIEVVRHEGVDYLRSCSPLDKSPWFLGIVKETYSSSRKWESFLGRQRLILLGCTLLALLVMVQIANVITDRLRSEGEERDAALGEAEHNNKLAAIGRLAAGVAHEINNPLAVINQRAGLLKDLLDLSEDFKHKAKFTSSIDNIQSSVKRCKVITHRLLGFARRMDTAFEHININDLLREVLGFLEKEALYSHINFKLFFDEELPLIFSDRGQLQQIFLNITNNSIDAIGKDGQITLTTVRLDSETIDVRISDTGPGMAPELVKRIFDPFFTTKEAGKGTGLGLSITYGLAKKLGGSIKVDSEPGKGTTFTVSLPINSLKQEGGFHG